MTQLHDVARMLEAKFPDAAALLEEAAEDILAHMHFPREHRRRLHSTNPLERLHKEIKRRTHVVGIFPSRDSLMRMVGTLLSEQDDEWQVTDRRYFSLGSWASSVPRPDRVSSRYQDCQGRACPSTAHPVFLRPARRRRLSSLPTRRSLHFFGALASRHGLIRRPSI
jgi:Transposase, Mutator family